MTTPAEQSATAAWWSPERRLHLAVTVAGVLAALVVLQSVTSIGHAPPWWPVAGAVAAFAAGDTALFHIRFGHNQQSFTWSETAVVVGLIMVPSPWLRLTAGVGVAIAHLARRRPVTKVAFNASSAIVGVVLARTAMHLIVPTNAVNGRSPRVLAGLAGAAVAYWLWNSVAVSAAVAFSQGLPFLTVYRKGLFLSALVAAGNTATGIVLVAVSDVNPAALAAVPVLCALLYVAYQGYLRAMRERDTWEVLQAASRELLQVDQVELARTVTERSRTLFNAEFVELLLVDSEPGTAVTSFRRADESAIETVKGSPFDVAASYWGRVLTDREPFQQHLPSAPTTAKVEMVALGLASYTVAPVLNENRCIGALRIGFRGGVRLGARELQVFNTFANHVSAAVNNARTFDEMRLAALRDPLTGLPNRALLVDRLGQALARSRREPVGVAVLFLDLDRFKVINDSLGHEAGDELIVAVSKRIEAQLRPGDTAVRFGGDEFVVVCEQIAAPSDAVAAAERLASALNAPFRIRGRDTYVTASVGVVLSRTGMENPVELLRDADVAMYQAKERGRARCEVFDDGLRASMVNRLERETGLRGAIDGGELVAYYQPTVNIVDQRIVGAEALVRWEHPISGLLQPAEFIAIAEESDLIVRLGEEVLAQAARDLRQFATLSLSVNVSPRQLAHPDFVATVKRIVEEAGAAPNRLCLEITEGALVADTDTAIAKLRQLRQLGFKIALDDFGTGYSSLSYLRQLPVDLVKIDRSFIANLPAEPREQVIVRSIIDVAHALDLVVVAEGVETAQQLAVLQDLGCDIAQGFYFARPGPIRETVELLESASLLS